MFKGWFVVGLCSFYIPTLSAQHSVLYIDMSNNVGLLESLNKNKKPESKYWTE